MTVVGKSPKKVKTLNKYRYEFFVSITHTTSQKTSNHIRLRCEDYSLSIKKWVAPSRLLIL